MQKKAAIRGIETRYGALAPVMNERIRRQWAAAEARSYGWGGIRAVSRTIGMSPNTIVRGLAELREREEHPDAPIEDRGRKEGGGRKQIGRASCRERGEIS